MPRASTSRSGFAVKSPVRPNVILPQYEKIAMPMRTVVAMGT